MTFRGLEVDFSPFYITDQNINAVNLQQSCRVFNILSIFGNRKEVVLRERVEYIFESILFYNWR